MNPIPNLAQVKSSKGSKVLDVRATRQPPLLVASIVDYVRREAEVWLVGFGQGVFSFQLATFQAHVSVLLRLASPVPYVASVVLRHGAGHLFHRLE